MTVYSLFILRIVTCSCDCLQKINLLKPDNFLQIIDRNTWNHITMDKWMIKNTMELRTC